MGSTLYIGQHCSHVFYPGDKRKMRIKAWPIPLPMHLSRYLRATRCAAGMLTQHPMQSHHPGLTAPVPAPAQSGAAAAAACRPRSELSLASGLCRSQLLPAAACRRRPTYMRLILRNAFLDPQAPPSNRAATTPAGHYCRPCCGMVMPEAPGAAGSLCSRQLGQAGPGQLYQLPHCVPALSCRERSGPCN